MTCSFQTTDPNDCLVLRLFLNSFKHPQWRPCCQFWCAQKCLCGASAILGKPRPTTFKNYITVFEWLRNESIIILAILAIFSIQTYFIIWNYLFCDYEVKGRCTVHSPAMACVLNIYLINNEVSSQLNTLYELF